MAPGAGLFQKASGVGRRAEEVGGRGSACRVQPIAPPLEEGGDGLPDRLLLWLAVERPAVAVGSAEQVVRFGAIRDATCSGVVGDLLPDAIGDQAQEHLFDHVAAVFEVAGGLEVSFAGVDPFLLEAVHFGDELVLGAALVIGEIGMVAVREDGTGGKVGNQVTACTLEEGAVVDVVEVEHARGGGGHGASLVPGDAHGGAPVIGRMIHVHLKLHGSDVGIESVALGFG